MQPVFNLGNIQIDLSAGRYRTQGFRAALAASSGGGKSTGGVVMIEEAHAIGLPWLVIDPDVGEHRALGELPGAVVMTSGRELPGPDWRTEAIGRVMRGGGVVCDISRLGKSEQRICYTYLLRELWRQQDERNPTPLLLFVEEAQVFAPQKRQQDAESLEITDDIARRGRKRGINWVLATQRPSDVEKDILAQSNVRFIGYLSQEHDFRAVESMLRVGTTARRNGARRTPPGVDAPELVEETLTHGDLLILSSGEFYLAGNGKVYKIRFRERRVSDLARTPIIEYRQRPLFERITNQ